MATERVLDQLAMGTRPERIAVAYPATSPYLRLLVRSLASAGIAWSGRSPDALAAMPTARFLSVLLAMSGGVVTRSGLVDLLRAAPVIDRRHQPIPVGEWDRCTRLAKIVHGNEEHWKRRLGALRARALSSQTRLDVHDGDPLERCRGSSDVFDLPS